MSAKFSVSQQLKKLSLSLVFVCTLLTSISASADRLINISTNGFVDATGMAAGFIVTGPETRKFVVLGERYNSSIDAVLSLTDLSGEEVFAINDNWRSHPTATDVQNLLREPGDDSDAAFAVTLEPGVYIARLTSANGVNGAGIVAINDVSGGSGLGRLINISTNGLVDTTSMAAGFILSGSGSRRIVVLGESYNSAIDPMLELTDLSGDVSYGSNNDWQEHMTAEEVETMLRAPISATDAAFALTLAPGVYIARLTSATGSSGAGIVAINDITSSVAPGSCGNGIIEVPEQCDDGNQIDGDGCSASCSIENTDPACQSNNDCSSSDYCQQSSPGAPGMCEARPLLCTTDYDPVCGFDDQTYSNACQAAAEGVNVAYTGECTVDNSCQSNNDCSSSDYCQQSSPGAPGMCEARPTACAAVFDPVCGFDDQTYSNACQAAAEGVNVAYTGECIIF